MTDRTKAFTEAADLCDYEATGYDDDSPIAEVLEVMGMAFREMANGKEWLNNKCFRSWQRERALLARVLNEREVVDNG